MRKFEFTLVLTGDLDKEEAFEALYATCADATFGTVDGIGFGDFHRRAETFQSALLSAIGDVERVGLSVIRVEPDDLVTMADIAHRLDRSREYIRLLVAGRKGRGDFPKPISHVRARSKLWRWSDVVAWAGITSEEDKERARIIAAVNAALELRDAEPDPESRKRLLDAVTVS